MARTPRLTKFILEALAGAKELGAELADVAFSFDGYQKARQHLLRRTNPDFYPPKNRHNFYSLMNHLHKQGLVEKNKKDNRLFWTITKLGQEKLKHLQNQGNLLPPKINYQTRQEKTAKLVIFDIPEKYKHKRIWLREQLIMLDFSLLQKSVWMGRNKISEELIKNLHDLNLLPYVHIFAVKDEGTINFKQ